MYGKEKFWDHDISFGKTEAKTLVKNFIVETLFVITLALFASYIRLLPKIKDNEYAMAILNEIFSAALRRDLLFPISNQEISLNNVLAQIELPIVQYFEDYRYNVDLHGNKFLEGKPYNLMNSIYSIIEPGKEMDFNNLLKYISNNKEKNMLPRALPLQDLIII